MSSLEEYYSADNWVEIVAFSGGKNIRVPLGSQLVSKYGFDEKFFGTGMSSELILQSACSGNLDISVHGVRHLPRSVNTIRCFYGKNGVVHLDGDDFSCKLLCSIDTRRDFKDIVGELKTIYDRINIIDRVFFDDNGVPRGNGADDGLDQEAQDALQGVIDYSESNDPFALKIKGVRVSDMSQRAMGLWLWDQVQERYQGNPPHGALSSLAREMKERFDLATLGYAISEAPTFRKMYNRTTSCIAACEVLPFS